MKNLILLVAVISILISNQSSAQKNIQHETENALMPDNSHSSIVARIDSSYRWRWDTLTSQWLVKYRTLYETDWMGNILVTTGQVKQGINFSNFSKNTKVYDANFNVISELIESWNGANWINGSRKTFTYDSNNRKTLELLEGWNSIASAWENQTQILQWWSTYNEPDSFMFQDWDGFIWVDEDKQINSFDVNNMLASSTGLDWDGISWVNYSQDQFTYNTNGDVSEILGYFWNGAGWDTSSLQEYLYDSGNLLYQYNYFTWMGSFWEIYLANYYHYDANELQVGIVTDLIVLKDSVAHYYTDVTGINENNYFDDDVFVYPNPAHDLLKIKFSDSNRKVLSMSIVDNAGRMISKQKVSVESDNYVHTVDVSDLSPGIYFLRLSDEKYSIVKKITKE